MKKYKETDHFHCGNESSENFSVSDCLLYTFGDLLNNTTRGAIAEFIVAKALGINTDEPRKDWLDYDLVYNGIKIEVKSSGYIQSWNADNELISNIKFSIKPAKDYDYKRRLYCGARSRKADLYIFCVLTEHDRERVDIIDVGQWDFWVIPTSEINDRCGDQATITLSSLKSTFAVPTLSYFSVKPYLDELCKIGK
jgi:hypothetical protein